MTDRPGGEQTASVLLATYNRRALLPAVLSPILADPAASEIVVVVDGGRDGSIELLEAMAKDDPRLKPLFIANGGAPRALLAGARVSSGDILVILDDDEIVDPGTISGHLRHHRGTADLVVVGYVEMDLPRTRRPGDFSRYKYAKAYEADCVSYERDASTILGNLWGGFISMRRSDYLQVMGGVEEFVEGYHYDLDFGARCIEHGLHAVFDRSLRARHLYERDRAGFLRDARSSGRNRILVHRAHPDVLPAIDPTFMERGLPRIARGALNLAVRHPAFSRLVDVGTVAAGRLHLWRLETQAATFAWMVEQKRGALEITDHEPGRRFESADGA